jgi:hypothetical protein
MEKRYTKVSEETKALVVPYADFTFKDLELIDKFKENGMIGLHTLKDTDCERCMALYLDGKTYRQISNVTKINKSVVLFLANKFKWFELRKEYLDELQATLKDKVMESKLQDQEFLMHLSLAYRKKIGKNVNEYLRTDNSDFADRIDARDIASYMKILELIHKLSVENIGNPSDKSLVGLNGLGEGVTITKTGHNSVEITPKEPSAFSSKLKAFAEMKRQNERENQPAPKVPHDIVVDQPKKEEKNE